MSTDRFSVVIVVNLSKRTNTTTTKKKEVDQIFFSEAYKHLHAPLISYSILHHYRMTCISIEAQILFSTLSFDMQRTNQ